MLKKIYSIYCFDFDGVIIESAHLKSAAYRELFEKYFPEYMSEIMDYHLKNSGLVRYRKIRYICENIAKIKNADALIGKMIKEYEIDIIEKVMNCPFVPGVIEYIEKLRNDKIRMFVVSGTPDDELKKIITERGISRYFEDIYGGSQNKTFWLKKIMNDTSVSADKILFFGDGLNDYEAAADCSIDFAFRLTGENNYLKEQINFLLLFENYYKLMM